MKPSSTSRSDSRFGGVLQPIVELLSRSPRESGRLVGQDIVLPRGDVSAIIAIDSNDDTHLLIAPTFGSDTRYTQLDLHGLKIGERDWAVAGRTSQRYLDVSCATGASPSFRRPFLRFAEDVLYELAQSGIAAADAVYRTGIRWRRFWSPEVSTHVTTEWLHGVFGELSFLVTLIERFGPTAVTSWSGPFDRPHDFQAGTEIAVEVKTSVAMPFTIHCGLNQLDPTIFRRLYLVCYRITASEVGDSLPKLVGQIEKLLGGNELLVERFYEALVAVGYRRELEAAYAESSFERSPPAVFEVNDAFPKLTAESFAVPPDHRVSNIHYTLQITGLPESSIDSVESDLARLAP